MSTGEDGYRDSSINFLSRPRLRWLHDEAPVFLMDIENLAFLDLSDDTYVISVDGQNKARLIRQEDGSYNAEPGTLQLSSEVALLNGRISDESGEEKYSMEIKLWDDSEEVNVFKMHLSVEGQPEGNRLDDAYDDRMFEGSSYVIVITSDLDFEPLSEWVSINQQFKAVYLTQNWSFDDVEVRLKGEKVWSPSSKAKKNATSYKARVINISAEKEPIEIETYTRFYINHSPGPDISYVRVNTRSVDFEKLDERRTDTQPIRISAACNSERLHFRIGFVDGSVEQYKMTADVYGNSRLQQSEWRSLPETSAIDISEATNDLFYFRPKHKDESWALMEGDLFLKIYKQKVQSLGGLVGLGGSLSLKSGPYNSMDSMPIAASVSNSGIIGDYNHASSRAALWPRKPIYPGGQHMIWHWTQDGEISSFEALPDSNDIAWFYEPADLKPLAVSVSYKGEWLGTWWTDDWYLLISSIYSAKPEETAFLLRWMRLPILEPNATSYLTELIGRYPVETLNSWRIIESLIDGMVIDTRPTYAEKWNATVRHIFRLTGHHLTDPAQMINLYKGPKVRDVDKFLDVVHVLSDIDPMLMYRFVKAWSVANKEKYSRNILIDLIEKARFESLYLDCKKDGPIDFENQVKFQSEKAATAMDVDQNFVSVLAKDAHKVFSNHDARSINNIYLASTLESFRILLTARLLQSAKIELRRL